jgi:hypothetical protein
LVGVQHPAEGRDPGTYYDEVHQYFASLPADRFPTIATLVKPMMTGDGDERFRFGLELLVEGLAALARGRAQQ